jgi:hypothetical protein
MRIDPTSFAHGLLVGVAIVGLIWFLASYVMRQ